ncbi:MAG: zf-HC2 domain-containing protein [Acidobacteria bacterium]|nr:zf-HC2 domain-containing protein [Acidobacteriota bacterium]
MKCEQAREQLPDYLADGLDPEERSELEEHFAGCASCREEAAAWTRLGELTAEEPSPALRARFEAMLEAYEEGLGRRAREQRTSGGSAVPGWLRGWWPQRPALQFACSVGFLIVGLGAGHLLTARGAADGQLSQLREEVHNMREMVALSLMQQQSASERLRGVNWSYRVDRPDSEVLAALLRTVKYDPSVDVRLAAADALRQFSQYPAVRQGLVEALGRQKSPLVQIALIDLLVDIRDRRAAGALRQLGADTSLEYVVRERVEQGLEKLGMGEKSWAR